MTRMRRAKDSVDCQLQYVQYEWPCGDVRPVYHEYVFVCVCHKCA